MDSAGQDTLAHIMVPKLHSTNPVGCLNGGRKRWTQVVGISPNDDPIVALLLEQSDDLGVQRSRYMALETFTAMSDDPPISLPAAN